MCLDWLRLNSFIPVDSGCSSLASKTRSSAAASISIGERTPSQSVSNILKQTKIKNIHENLIYFFIKIWFSLKLLKSIYKK